MCYDGGVISTYAYDEANICQSAGQGLASFDGVFWEAWVSVE